MKKVIIVTGASSGIGKATALQLIKEGHSVYGAARRVEKMNELVSAGGKAVALDLTNHNQVHTEIQKIIETEGRVDVLVNNAGYGYMATIGDVDMEAMIDIPAGTFLMGADDGFADERPQIAGERTSYTYYPGTQEVPVNAAANIINRPHSITADVDFNMGDEGVLFSQGGIDANRFIPKIQNRPNPITGAGSNENSKTKQPRTCNND